MNFYEALDLSPTATSEEIEEAYRKLARKVHPDLNQHEKMPAEARMKVLNEIRDTLINPERRAAYDAKMAEGPEGANIDAAITDTPRETRDSILTRKRPRLTVLAGLLFGALVGAGIWYLIGQQPSPIEPTVSPGHPISDPPVPPPIAVEVPKSRTPNRPAQLQKRKAPEVVQLGSSIQAVLDLMGKPDRVEEIPTQDIRVLHYGKLRLVFKNSRLVPESGVQKDP
jgi:DnaJ domain